MSLGSRDIPRENGRFCGLGKDQGLFRGGFALTSRPACCFFWLAAMPQVVLSSRLFVTIVPQPVVQRQALLPPA